MKKHYYAALILVAIVLFPVLHLNAQEEKNEQIWYCWEETVKPEMIEEYLTLSKEMIDLCKQENFPYPIVTWIRKSMVYELWSPVSSLNEIDSIENEWAKILKIWGEEKYAAFNQTKLHNYSKTITLQGDLGYMPEDPQIKPEERNYGRWIEIYLKPGTQKEFMEAVKWINEQRAAFDIDEYLMMGAGGIGYQAPSYFAYYFQVSQVEFQKYFDSTPNAYKEKFQEYLERIRKLFIQPPEIYHYSFLQELSYEPERP